MKIKIEKKIAELTERCREFREIVKSKTFLRGADTEEGAVFYSCGKNYTAYQLAVIKDDIEKINFAIVELKSLLEEQ